MDPRIREIEKSYLRNDLPAFAPGDTVRVRVRVREGDKERVQPFEGVCIARRGGGLNETFTLRRVSGGVGVERIFPLHSPWIAGLEVVRRGDVRRAKLYYLRARRGKRARVRERKWWLDKAHQAEREAMGVTADDFDEDALYDEENAGPEAPAEDVSEDVTAEGSDAASESEAGATASEGPDAGDPEPDETKAAQPAEATAD